MSTKGFETRSNSRIKHLGRQMAREGNCIVSNNFEYSPKTQSQSQIQHSSLQVLLKWRHMIWTQREGPTLIQREKRSSKLGNRNIRRNGRAWKPQSRVGKKPTWIINWGPRNIKNTRQSSQETCPNIIASKVVRPDKSLSYWVVNMMYKKRRKTLKQENCPETSDESRTDDMIVRWVLRTSLSLILTS